MLFRNVCFSLVLMFQTLTHLSLKRQKDVIRSHARIWSDISSNVLIAVLCFVSIKETSWKKILLDTIIKADKWLLLHKKVRPFVGVSQWLVKFLFLDNNKGKGNYSLKSRGWFLICLTIPLISFVFPIFF